MSVGGTQQPGVWTESIYQGDSWSHPLTTPWDLSTYTALTITIFGEDVTPLLELSVGNGITVGGTGNTVLTPTITGIQSAALPLGTWAWAWVFTDAIGNVRTYIVGSITVKARA